MVPTGATLPDLPPAGVRSAADSAELQGSAVIDLSAYDPAHNGANIAPGLRPDSFAYAKTTSHRNLSDSVAERRVAHSDCRQRFHSSVRPSGRGSKPARR